MEIKGRIIKWRSDAHGIVQGILNSAIEEKAELKKLLEEINATYCAIKRRVIEWAEDKMHIIALAIALQNEWKKKYPKPKDGF